MSKKKKKEEEKRYTVADAAKDTVEIVVEVAVVAPVVWLLDKTVGSVLDLT